jgi:hypothetical protein
MAQRVSVAPDNCTRSGEHIAVDNVICLEFEERIFTVRPAVEGLQAGRQRLHQGLGVPPEIG